MLQGVRNMHMHKTNIKTKKAYIKKLTNIQYWKFIDHFSQICEKIKRIY